MRKSIRHARNSHCGGYYCYASAGEAVMAEAPTESKCFDLPRVIIACDVAGAKIVYDDQKIARTYLRPIEIVASLIPTTHA